MATIHVHLKFGKKKGAVKSLERLITLKAVPYVFLRMLPNLSSKQQSVFSSLLHVSIEGTSYSQLFHQRQRLQGSLYHYGSVWLPAVQFTRVQLPAEAHADLHSAQSRFHAALASMADFVHKPMWHTKMKFLTFPTSTRTWHNVSNQTQS